MTSNERVLAAVGQLERTIQRAAASKQPRFSERRPEDFFAATLKWVRQATQEEPEYQADSRERDKWLRDFWRSEPHLAGVLNSVVAIDANRGWSLTGGRNQVNRYTDVLRQAEDGAGWRTYGGLQALSYYTADLGFVTELGRDGRDGPVRALWHVDPAKCRLTGRVGKPLAYDGSKDPWRPGDFFRGVSMRSTDEDLNGLGYCATSRCLELAQIMIGVYEHDHEKLGSRAPKGLLLLKGVSADMWTTAMATREETLTGLEREHYGGVAVLASMADDVDAKLVALSQLPDGFDLEKWTNLLMYGYALCLGYDPIEFWPVQAGALGRGKETEIQHQKATGKGAASFMRAHQEQVQMTLPPSLLFEYEQRDQQGLLLEAEVAQAWANVAKTLYEQGLGVLTKDQVASLLAENGVIPMEWTVMEEDSRGSDSGEMEGEAATTQARKTERERLLESEPVQRAIALYPNDPIIRYEWPTHRSRVLWRSGRDAVPRSWRVVGGPTVAQMAAAMRRLTAASPDARGEMERLGITRADDVLYQGDDFAITEADVDRAIANGRERVGDEFADLLEAPTLTGAETDALDAG